MESDHNGGVPFDCEHCDLDFDTEKDLKKHMESVHNGGVPFDCELFQEILFLSLPLRKVLICYGT